MNWDELRFEDLYAEPSRNGVYKPKQFHGAGAKIVNMGELFRYEFIGGQEMARLEMTGKELAKSGLCNGDLLFGRRSLVESGAGKCSIVQGVDEPVTFESSLIRVRPDPERALPKFLYYWFRSPIGKGRIRAIVSGTNVKGIRGSDLKNVLVTLPDRDVQDRIASILSAYDDLIENNRRRIALLEEAARQLYKEWFVRFRFPGHEHVKVINGIPEGWSNEPLFELATPTYGYAFKSTLFSEEQIGRPVVRIRDVPIRESGTWTSEEAPEDKLLENGDFLVGMDGDFHMNYWAGGQAWLNQRVVRLAGSDRMTTGLLRSSVEQQIIDLNETITGTTVKHLGAKHLKQIELLVPPDRLLLQANEFFEQNREMIVNLSVTNRKLSKARDLLLPKLMSGTTAV